MRRRLLPSLLCLLAALYAAAPAAQAQHGFGGMMGPPGKGKPGKGGKKGQKKDPGYGWSAVKWPDDKKGDKQPKAGKDQRMALEPRAYPGPGGPLRTPLPPVLGEEDGVAPTFHPPAVDQRGAGEPVHGDALGGADQVLLALSGSPAGFAGVFQDQRGGAADLTLARLDVEGARLGEQLLLSDQPGEHDRDPAVAAAGSGAGACAWTSSSGRAQAGLRFFDPQRAAWSRMLPLGSASYRERVEAAEAEARNTPVLPGETPPAPVVAGPPSLPALAARGERTFVAWIEGPVVYLQTCADGNGEQVPVALNLGDAPATGRPRIALGDDGGVLIAWETEEAIALAVTVERAFEEGEHLAKPRTATGGRGKLRGALADPRGGFWLLVGIPPGVVLRHVGAGGSIDGPDLPVALGRVGACEAATWAGGIAVLCERQHDGPAAGGATERRTLELAFFGRAGELVGQPPLRFDASARARGAFLAGEGARGRRLLVAWNDERDAGLDVFHAFLERGPGGPRLTAEARWNDDEASSHQAHAACASTGARAVVAWEDERASDGQVFFRLIGPDGAGLGAERPAAGPEPVPVRSMRRPDAAMNEDGRFLLAWAESAGGGAPFRLRAQAFGAAGEALAPPVDVDPGAEVSADFAPAAAALGRNQGYVLAWIRPEEGPVARRLSLSGELLGEAVRLTDRPIPSAANTALALVEAARLVCVWDEPGDESGSTRVLTGRFLAPDCRPEGAEIDFDWSGGGGDVDPELAPSGDGGFLLSWTGREGPEGDVLARFYGPDGEPAGPPLAISVLAGDQDASDIARLADGSGWIVVFEDDLSGGDRALARRIGPERTELGRAVALDEQGRRRGEARRAPRAVPLGDGFAALWADAQGRGLDVALRAFGPGFDRDPILPGAEPPASGEPGGG